MTNVGQLSDTYIAALQHDLADVSPDTYKLGVVRRPTPWFYGQVDDNEPTLGPPADLLDTFQERREELEDTDLSAAEAHNQAAADVSFDDQYRAYLEQSEEPQPALEAIQDRLQSGQNIALVCYENTDEKQCHRTVLREYLEAKR